MFFISAHKFSGSMHISIAGASQDQRAKVKCHFVRAEQSSTFLSVVNWEECPRVRWNGYRDLCIKVFPYRHASQRLIGKRQRRKWHRRNE